MGRRRPPPLDYVARTQSLPLNLLFLMPFVLVYQGALLATNSPVENAAAASMRRALAALGPALSLGLSLSFCLVLGAIVLVRARNASRDRGVLGGMMLESLAYGLLLGLVAEVLSRVLPLGHFGSGYGGAPASTPIAALGTTVHTLGLAIGAGVFEELLFRGLLMMGLLFVFQQGLGAGRIGAALLAVPIAAYVFSDYHHWGPGGEVYVREVFAFRFHAGLILGAICVTRGLGIAAVAHGVYDVLVMVF